MARRPPRKCSTLGEGMVCFGMAVAACDWVKLKSSRKTLRFQAIGPVTRSRCFSVAPWNCTFWSGSYNSTPSRPARKS